ncbi:hypothetical protein P7K49_022411, partial [Saguinus oedipus]
LYSKLYTLSARKESKCRLATRGDGSLVCKGQEMAINQAHSLENAPCTFGLPNEDADTRKGNEGPKGPPLTGR